MDKHPSQPVEVKLLSMIESLIRLKHDPVTSPGETLSKVISQAKELLLAEEERSQEIKALKDDLKCKTHDFENLQFACARSANALTSVVEHLKEEKKELENKAFHHMISTNSMIKQNRDKSRFQRRLSEALDETRKKLISAEERREKQRDYYLNEVLAKKELEDSLKESHERIKMLQKRVNENKIRCNICWERDINRVIIPCFHAICYECYGSLDKNRRQCPFCRNRFRASNTKTILQKGHSLLFLSKQP
jgi:hypothetical protein